MENATTKEELTVRNACFKNPAVEFEIDIQHMEQTLIENIHYVEILRHPRGADVKMREWVKQMAYHEKKYTEEANQVITIGGWTPLTIG